MRPMDQAIGPVTPSRVINARLTKGAPSGHQGGTQWAPRAHPVGTKGAPSGHQGGTQWAPRGHQGGTQWAPRGHPVLVCMVVQEGWNHQLMIHDCQFEMLRDVKDFYLFFCSFALTFFLNNFVLEGAVNHLWKIQC